MLLTTLKAFGARVWGYVVLAGAILAGLFALRQSGKAAGKQEAVTEALKRDQQARKQADAVAGEVDRLDDDSLVNEFDRLHDARRR